MSIIFGIRKSLGSFVSNEEVLHLAAATKRHAPDGTSVMVRGRIGMGFQPYLTHERSNLELQPAVDAQGNMLCLDGRIDNHAGLRRLLDICEESTPDSLIVLAAFRRWREDCFSKLIGDWALALWSAVDEIVYLARDHAGARTLYFGDVSGDLQWATYLDTFSPEGTTCALDENYATSYLALLPIRDLTPFKGIRSVQPAHYLAINNRRVAKHSHWDWMATDQIRYKSDEEYEQHFLSLFKQSVQRRTGPGAPILAQLSGGMDSSSIVCVSDSIRRNQEPDAEILDTISFYDDDEPNWNESPYFSIVEAIRGRAGVHFKTSFINRSFEPPDPSCALYPFPGVHSSPIRQEEEVQCYLNERGYRAILSGIGGDEVLGGVPTPLPELADYLFSGDIGQLFTQAFAWSLAARMPIILTIGQTAALVATLYRRQKVDVATLPPWLSPRIRASCVMGAMFSSASGLAIRPSAVSNGLAWWSTVETLPHLLPSALTRYEYRYPYLDRDLIDYLFRVPREQLVRPGRRRSLMRRALRGIVPTEILERSRKAFIIRGPLTLLRQSHETIRVLLDDSLVGQRGLIDPVVLQHELHLATTNGDPKWCIAILRTLDLELWLRARSGRFRCVPSTPVQENSSLRSSAAQKFHASLVED